MKSRSSRLFPLAVLITFSLACQTLTKAFTSNPGGSTQNENPSLAMEWLVTANELNSFSTDIGIVSWAVIEDTPGENRICRSFQGASWSAIPNEGLNCVFTVSKGLSFQSVIDWMFDEGRLYEGSQPVNSNLNLDGESAIYAGDYPNGHAVFDLILVHDGHMYWSSVSLGRAPGDSPQSVYQSASQVIDAFLVKVITINLDKSK
ncbi:MAG: hypothetical protein JNM55_20245 [Anaerolineales bacterium]|nr:hypothetical protein [Anaerolineales bacterium]